MNYRNRGTKNLARAIRNDVGHDVVGCAHDGHETGRAWSFAKMEHDEEWNLFCGGLGRPKLWAASPAEAALKYMSLWRLYQASKAPNTPTILEQLDAALVGWVTQFEVEAGYKRGLSGIAEALRGTFVH